MSFSPLLIQSIKAFTTCKQVLDGGENVICAAVTSVTLSAPCLSLSFTQFHINLSPNWIDHSQKRWHLLCLFLWLTANLGNTLLLGFDFLKEEQNKCHYFIWGQLSMVEFWRDAQLKLWLTLCCQITWYIMVLPLSFLFCQIPLDQTIEKLAPGNHKNLILCHCSNRQQCYNIWALSYIDN